MPILIKPAPSKSAVESTDNVVAVDVRAVETSVDLFARPKFSRLSYNETIDAAGIELLSLLSAPLVIPVKVVAVIPV